MSRYKKLTQWRIKFRSELQKVYPEVREREEIFFLTAMHLLKISKTELRMDLIKDRELQCKQSKNFEYLLIELKNYRPIQYLLNETFFYNIHIKVNEDVFIPRAETEELVHWIIQEIYLIPKPRILDIGTGSGCIALSLKKQFPQSEVYALDSSSKAIKCAKKNAHLHNLHMHFIHLDILRNFPNNLPLFDVIVSNPPYVRHSEKTLISQSILKYEPAAAIFPPKGSHPLIFYEKIASSGLNNLTKNGAIYFEINQYLSKEIIDLLKKIGYKSIKLKNDMQGLSRMIKTFVL